MCFDSFFHNLVLPDVPLPLIDASLSFLPGSMFIRTLHIVVRMSVKYVVSMQTSYRPTSASTLRILQFIAQLGQPCYSLPYVKIWMNTGESVQRV